MTTHLCLAPGCEWIVAVTPPPHCPYPGMAWGDLYVYILRQSENSVEVYNQSCKCNSKHSETKFHPNPSARWEVKHAKDRARNCWTYSMYFLYDIHFLQILLNNLSHPRVLLCPLLATTSVFVLLRKLFYKQPKTKVYTLAALLSLSAVHVRTVRIRRRQRKSFRS